MLIISFILVTGANTILANNDTSCVNEIKVVGNKRIDDIAIQLQAELIGIDCINKQNLINAKKALHKTNLFQSVDLSTDENILTITIKENPLITDIVFIGNSGIKTPIIESKMLLR